jgi:hypothetical protein
MIAEIFWILIGILVFLCMVGLIVAIACLIKLLVKILMEY